MVRVFSGALRGDAKDAYGTAEDEEDGVAGVAFMEDQLATAEAADIAGRGQGVESGVVQPLQEGCRAASERGRQPRGAASPGAP